MDAMKFENSSRISDGSIKDCSRSFVSSVVADALSPVCISPRSSGSSSVVTERDDGIDGAGCGGDRDKNSDSLWSKGSGTSSLTTVIGPEHTSSDTEKSSMLLRQTSDMSQLSSDTERATDSDDCSDSNSSSSTGSRIRPPTSHRGKEQRPQLRTATDNNKRGMERTRFGGWRLVGGGSVAAAVGKGCSSSTQAAVGTDETGGQQRKAVGASEGNSGERRGKQHRKPSMKKTRGPSPMSGEFLPNTCPLGLVFKEVNARRIFVGRSAGLILQYDTDEDGETRSDVCSGQSCCCVRYLAPLPKNEQSP